MILNIITKAMFFILLFILFYLIGNPALYKEMGQFVSNPQLLAFINAMIFTTLAFLIFLVIQPERESFHFEVSPNKGKCPHGFDGALRGKRGLPYMDFKYSADDTRGQDCPKKCPERCTEICHHKKLDTAYQY